MVSPKAKALEEVEATPPMKKINADTSPTDDVPAEPDEGVAPFEDVQL